MPFLAENSLSKSTRMQLDEYRGKFPEIPDEDLLKIFQKVS